MGLTGADGPASGRVLAGRYRLDSVLGRGGMGVVWRAVDTLIERTVAIKELRAPIDATDDEQASFVERALREARNAGRLNHPGVVAVHDVLAQPGEHDTVYIVMEYVPASSLAELLDHGGPLPAARVAVIGLGILDALDAAHALGIVHRDVKPGNVLIGAGDRIKLTDFGIALAAEDTRLTKSGVIGTQGYLAPECFDTGHAGPAADLWALGATLYHAAVGHAPFERDTTTATLRAILFDDVPAPPTEPRLAEAITGLLTRSLDHRLSSAAARQLLEHVAVGPAGAPTREGEPAPRPGQAPWEANATSLSRLPIPPPPPVQAPPPQYLPMGPPPGGRSRTPWIVTGVLAAVLAVVLVLVFTVFTGKSEHDADPTPSTALTAPSTAPTTHSTSATSSAGPSTAQAAAVAYLEASKKHDAGAAKAAQCEADQLSPLTSGLQSPYVVSYSITKTSPSRDHTIVEANIHYTDHVADDAVAQVPAVSEDGTWKVCFSKLLAARSGKVAPSTGRKPCHLDRTAGPWVVADFYTGTLGSDPATVAEANGCVYRGSPAGTHTKQLLGNPFIMLSDAGGRGPFLAQNQDNELLLKITVTKEPDGRYWVTDLYVF